MRLKPKYGTKEIEHLTLEICKNYSKKATTGSIYKSLRKKIKNIIEVE